jgi:hypothetical protein
MAKELLLAKGVTKDVGINWTQRFLYCYPTLKSRYITLIDKSRVLLEDPDQIL